MLSKLSATDIAKQPELASKLNLLFSNSKVQAPKALLQGHNGYVWLNDANRPTAAQIQVGPFHFFAGNPEHSRELLNNFGEYMCATVFTPEWVAALEKHCRNRFDKETRTLFSQNESVFNKARLEQLASTLPSGYSIRAIDHDAIENPDVHGLIPCTGWQYQNAEDFLDRGFGFVVEFDNQIVGAAASFNNYDDGIEIDISIEREHRQKGLATAVGATLILHCLANDLYPYWDAANAESVKLAKKLGYAGTSEYDSYVVYRFFAEG